MGSDYAAGSIVTHTSLRDYFHGELIDAMRNQHIAAGHATLHYLTNLLAMFARSEALFERSDGGDGVAIKPLAMTYGEALHENGAQRRTRLLQRLGDTALFIAGMFTDSLKSRIVDVDYYIAMGAAAYSSLSDAAQHDVSLGRAASIFDELTRKFRDFVDVLNEVSERAARLRRGRAPSLRGLDPHRQSPRPQAVA